MLETMYAGPGVGLAAPQVGVRQRVIFVDVGEEPMVLIDPEITATDGQQVGLEGRLSLPDLVGEVRRAQWVTVKGLDRRGRPTTVEGEGLLARTLQHEVPSSSERDVVVLVRGAQLERSHDVQERKKIDRSFSGRNAGTG
jgi:peptide deformylase